MRKLLIIAAAFGSLVTGLAEAKTYVRDYNYKASDMDSKVTSRANALDQVKLILLQEIGTHIRQQIKISKDNLGNEYATEDIEAITAGLTKVEIIEESWNGETYYLKAKIFADTDRVLNALEEFRKDTSAQTQKQLKELQENQKQLENARNEVAQLREQLAKAKSDQERNQIAATYSREVKRINEWEPKTAFDGRVGTIQVTNDSRYKVNLTLWHPDSKAPFDTYPIEGQSDLVILYNNAPINIGSDWGVQIGSRNSPVKTVVDVSSWSSTDNRWYLKTSVFHEE